MIRSSANNITPIRPELELLIFCARTHVRAKTAESIRLLLQKNVDWSYLIELGRRHKISPLIYRSLNTTAWEYVPKDIMDQLRDYFHANAKRNLLLTKELQEILNVFEDNGITAIPYKGAVLAKVAYGNISFREFYDLDILLHKGDVRKAKQLMISRGYIPNLQIAEAQMETALESQYEYQFVSSESKTMVELHWGVAERYLSISLDPEVFWDRAEMLSLEGKNVLNIAPEDMLILLCIHGSKHLWKWFALVCDVSELISAKQDIDWEMVMDQAEKLYIKRMILLGVYLANELLQSPVPEKILRLAKKDRAIAKLALKSKEWLFAESDEPVGSAEMQAFHIMTQKRFRVKIKYYFRLLITPKIGDQMFVRLPKSLSFLHYLIRPIRLFRDYIIVPLKHKMTIFRSSRRS